jgi:hypothetical protein
MLDAETRRHIDSCRDILVGKVLGPKSRVEEIEMTPLILQLPESTCAAGARRCTDPA